MKKAKLLKFIVLLGSALGLAGCDFSFFTPSEKQLFYSDAKANSYEIGEVFDDFVCNGGLSPQVKLSNNFVRILEKGEFTYELHKGDLSYSGTTAFSEEGEYNVTVFRPNLDSVNYNITVNDPSRFEGEVSASDAVSIIETLEENKISEVEYYVRGIATNVEIDENGFNGSFLGANLEFRSVKGNGFASVPDDINGKEVVIRGYLENYKGIYQIPYLPAEYSPTGSRYNAQLMFVQNEEEEHVDPTDISISPVSKTIKVGDTATLSAKVLPENATNKTVTWSSDESSVCSVDKNGKITGVSEGRAVITAKTINGKSATCNVTVDNESITPVEGDKFEITFNNFESDGQTALTKTNVLDQVTSGKSYIGSVVDISRIYKGIHGLKFGTSSTGGSIKFEVASSLKELVCKQIILDIVQYGLSSTTVNLSVDDTLLISGSSSSSQIVGTLTSPESISNIMVSTTRRAYLSKITLICEDPVPVPVTGISIPSTKAISTGNSETLTVTYSPSNANTGKGITWTTNDKTVATVSDGVVTGVAPGIATITATSEEGFKSTCEVTISNVNVTSVSLSSTSETIGVGQTKQLTATVSPSNATDKSVSWSSSKTTVATVSSTGLVTAVSDGTTTITVKTNDGNKTATCNVSVVTKTKDSWTIMIYMCGADLESENGLATSDLKEILSVSGQPDDVNILVETGGAKSWSLSSSYLQGATSISSSNLSRWHVDNKKLVLDDTLTYASMGSSSTLESFVKWGLNEYPAEKNGVIFWNHGGAMYGCCYDEKKNDDSLENSEMNTAFKNAFSATGTSKLEFVGYDCCLMQVQDIAEFNSKYFNYMVASEEAEAGYGWDYDTWIDDVYADKSTDTILTSIVDGFIKDNGGASSTRSDQTLSWLDLTKMAAYKSAFESFASALKSQLSNKSVSKSTFANFMMNNVKAFAEDNDDSEKYYCLFDVKDMLDKISVNSTYNPGSSYINAVYTAFSDLVKYSVAQKGAGKAYGLGCIYCQSSYYSNYISSEYTSSETNFTNWLSFLKSYSYLGY